MKPSMRRFIRENRVAHNAGDKIKSVAKLNEARQLAQAGGNHLAFVRTLKDGWVGVDDALAKIKEHKKYCAGCTAQITDEIRGKLHV